MSGPLELSIIIVNWRSVEFLQKCLATIYATTRGIEFEVIVVDNASFDGAAEMTSRVFPQVRFVQSQKNIGFAKANNLGFRHSAGENLLLLNPDTEIVGDAFPTMLSVLRSNPGAGIVGCKLLNSDGSIQMSCVQRFPSILNQAVDADYLRAKFPGLAIWGTRAVTEPDCAPAPVEVISGACLLIRRSIFEKLNGLSSDYFMYAEDVDLCYRTAQLGWKAYYTGQAEVIHHGGRSSDSATRNNFAAILTRESLVKYMQNTRGNLYAFAYKATTGIVALFRWLMLSSVWLILLGRKESQSLALSRAKWGKVFRWAIGLEGWAKELVKASSAS
jgi:hypothetical protein